MANQKITQLTALTTPIRTDVIAIVDDPGGSPVTKKMELTYMPGWIYPSDSRWVGTANMPLTSASWDGDAFSTTAKTLIDLSAVFGVPAGVKAVQVFVSARDSGSAGSTGIYIYLSPNNTAFSVAVPCRLGGLPNDFWGEGNGVVPCNADGDIYYEIVASGAGTIDVYMQIWGYMT